MNKILGLLSLLLVIGCSTKPAPMKLLVSPMMATAYSGGAMAITWKALKDQTYTIYYTDTPKGKPAEWKPLPQATRLAGEGKQITISDQIAADSPRRYMLLTGDQTPY